MFNTSNKTDGAEKMDVDDEEKIEIISDFIFYMEFKQNLYRIISNFIFFEEGNLSEDFKSIYLLVILFFYGTS